MPRPACCVSRSAVENPGSRTSCSDSSSVSSWSGLEQSHVPRLGADRRDVEARAVVLDGDHDLGALALQSHGDPAGLGLAAHQAILGELDAVHDGVAQHVLEGRQHALEDLPVDLAVAALDHEFDFLAGLLRRLPREARQALAVTLERHHARAHQSVLQLRHDAALLLQQVLALAVHALEQALDARDVADRLGERPRQLLDRRIAVELQRIEVLAPLGRRSGA